MVHFSHPYMITGKTIALTAQTFVGKFMSLLFNTQSRFVMAFLRSKSLLISWLQSLGGAQENKISHCFHFLPYLFAMKWWDGMGYCDLSFSNVKF